MDYPNQRGRFGILREASDYSGIRQLLIDNTDYYNDSESRTQMMIDAAMLCERPDLLALLHDMGISLDVAQVGSPLTRPISVAASLNRWDNLRWLVEHGAEVNYEVPGREPFCIPLSKVVREGRLDMVKLLVEAGAALDVCDRRNLTPLGCVRSPHTPAQAEVAAYLRSKGAILPEQARNYEPEPPATPVNQYVESVLGNWVINRFNWQAIVPDPVPVAIYFASTEEFYGVYSDGMSALPMAVPPGKERFRYAELALPLGGECWSDDPKAWGEERVWVVQWLRRLANIPFEENTWLGDPYCIIANGDPPAPLSPYTKMTCWLCLVDKEPLTGFTRPDGTEVVFYTLIPIHTAERDYGRKKGLKALLKIFAKRGTTPYLDPTRESVV